MSEYDFADNLFRDIKKSSEEQRNIRKTAALAIPQFLVDLDSRLSPKPLIKMAQLHIDMHEFVDNNPLACVVVPRNHGKTEQLPIGGALVDIGNDPDARIKMISESKDLASSRVVSVREHITANKKYKELYPNIVPSKSNWGTESISVKRNIASKDATLTAYGAYSAITGDRASVIYCDDICGQTSQLSKADREKVKAVFWNSIMNLLQEPGGRLIYVATPWHYDDLTMNIIKGSPDNGFAVFYRPIDKDLNPIWPEKWSRKALESKRKKFYAAGEPGAWSRGYLCEPLADTDATFNRGDVENSIVAKDPSNPYREAKINDEEWIIIMMVDPAISKKSQADFTVIFVGAVHIKKRIRVPLDIVRRKMNSPETTDEIIRMYNYWNPVVIGIEKAGYQESLSQWTQKESKTPLPIIPITPKLSKDERIHNLAVSFASKAWKIYMHQNPLSETASPCNCGFCIFIEEMVNHPASRHDDTPDAAEMFDTKAIEMTRTHELVFDMM